MFIVISCICCAVLMPIREVKSSSTTTNSMEYRFIVLLLSAQKIGTIQSLLPPRIGWVLEYTDARFWQQSSSTTDVQKDQNAFLLKISIRHVPTGFTSALFQIMRILFVDWIWHSAIYCHRIRFTDAPLSTLNLLCTNSSAYTSLQRFMPWTMLYAVSMSSWRIMMVINIITIIRPTLSSWTHLFCVLTCTWPLQWLLPKHSWHFFLQAKHLSSSFILCPDLHLTFAVVIAQT